MDEVYLLWFLSISMLVCSFLAGLVPLAFRLSDNKSRLLALLGSGILVGTALSIIIPEGVDSLYGAQQPNLPSARSKELATAKHGDSRNAADHPSETANSTSTGAHDIIAEQILSESQNKAMTWLVGTSLILGFLLMLLIEQFSIYQGGGGHQHGPEMIHTNSIRTSYTLACQEDDVDIGLEEEEDGKPIINATSSDSVPVRDTHKIAMRTATVDGPEIAGININPNRYYDHSRHMATHKLKNAKVTPTLGLVIHAAADGIALGAAATTSHRDVEMIIFLAIMLHKAPAAFSLVVLLLHNGLRPTNIRRHLLAFSLSAPIAAIVTYYGLSQSGKEALRRNNATGVAMLFSAGTFLFVATVHVLPELIQNKLLTPREMFCLLGGAFLPLLLTQLI